MERPEERNELKRLRQRVRRLETALADSQVELAVERAYVRLACERAGIHDVGQFKKEPMGSRTPGRRGRGPRFEDRGERGVPALGDEPAELLRPA